MSITKEELRNYFHLPLKDAAVALSTCVTALKKICRKNNIEKWPYRQIRSLQTSIEQLKLTRSPLLGHEALDEIDKKERMLIETLHAVMEDPTSFCGEESRTEATTDGQAKKVKSTSKVQAAAAAATALATKLVAASGGDPQSLKRKRVVSSATSSSSPPHPLLNAPSSSSSSTSSSLSTSACISLAYSRVSYAPMATSMLLQKNAMRKGWYVENEDEDGLLPNVDESQSLTEVLLVIEEDPSGKKRRVRYQAPVILPPLNSAPSQTPTYVLFDPFLPQNEVSFLPRFSP